MNRTITSLSIVATLWDQHRKDYLECYIPMLATLILRKEYAQIDIETVTTDFQEEYGLSIPYHPMVALLNRATKRGLLQRQVNVYVPVLDEMRKHDVSALAQQNLTAISGILAEIVQFASELAVPGFDIARAETAMIAFLAQYDADILFATDTPTVLPRVKPSRHDIYVISKYVERVFSSPHAHARDQLVNIAAGHILAGAITFSDIMKYSAKSKRINVYLDTQFIFRLLGFDGPFRARSYAELVSLINAECGYACLFQHTYDEIMQIIRNCEHWLNNPNYDPLKASPVLRYFVETNARSSDIDRLIITLRDRLEKEHNISIRPAPVFDANRNDVIDELALQNAILDVYGLPDITTLDTYKKRTILRDIKSISSVHVLRRGRPAHTLREAKHLFITTNSGLAAANRQYEISVDTGSIVFACVTDVFLGTVLWAQSPAALRTIITNNLIANCQAILQPTPALLRRYTERLKELHSQGTISEQEFYLLRSQRLALALLVDHTLGDPAGFSDELPEQILHDMQLRTIQDAVTARDRAVTAQIQAEEQLRIVRDKTLQVTRKISSFLALLVALLFLLTTVTTLIYQAASPTPNKTVMIIAAILGILSAFFSCDFFTIRHKLTNIFATWLAQALTVDAGPL